MSDEQFMKEAIRLAIEGVEAGTHPGDADAELEVGQV